MDRPDALPVRPAATPMRGAATPLKTPLRTPLCTIDQTSTTPITPFEKIEAQKENVQPRARGRSAHALSTALCMTPKERHDTLAAQRREHEANVHSTANAEADDPLEAWCAYVKWCIDNYPDGKSAESGIVPLLERATRTFRDSEQYRHDSRYLRLWILYAQHTDVPRDIFHFLLANEIGTNLASLYEELSNVLESQGAYDEADDTYRLGIARRARPLDRLKRRYNEYQQRILSLPELADEPRTSYAHALSRAMAKAGRSVLGTKTGRTESQPTNVLGSHQSLSSAPRPNARTMHVYCDENDDAPAGTHAAWTDVASMRRKENQTGARTLQPLPQSSAMTPRTQARALEVFCDSDEDASPRRTPRAAVLTNSTPSEADQLRRQPFLHYPPAALAQASRAPATNQRASSSHKRGTKPTSERHAAPLARLYPDVDIFTYVRDKARPIPRTTERCWEELYAERHAPSSSGADPWAYLDAQVGEWWPRQEVRRPPSPTVVTKAAILEVDNMFNGDSESDSDDSEDSASDESVRYAVVPSEENACAPEEALRSGPSRRPFQPLTPITERTESSRVDGVATPPPAMPVPYGGLRAPPSTLHLPNPCSPADPDVVAALLSNLAVPLSALPGYVDGGDTLKEILPQLQARLGKVGASRRASVGAFHECCVADMQLSVCARLGEGGYGTVFLAQDLNGSVPLAGEAVPSYDDVDADDVDELERRQMLALKMESPPSGWEYYILTQLRHRLPTPLQRSVVGARRFVWGADASLLLLEYASKGTLLELVNQASAAGVSSALTGSGVEEVLAMFFVVELCRVVEGLHTAGILHGDLKIDNCMIRADDTDEWSATYAPDGSGGWAAKGVTLIDFGRAIDLWCYEPGQRFLADWAPGAQDCVEMREMRPWTYQADYYGLASIAYCLLFGRYMDTTSYVGEDGRPRYRLQQPLRRYWQTDLWTRFFDLTLNPTQAGPLPITELLAALRSDMEAWLTAHSFHAGKNLKGLLKKVEIWALRRA
ncbi:non-specific serine/threonine protein kinase [Malassezia nana]|uniref:Non-specific serine/threonine protein kinase n=1 Tax=Malassezia nana TaxID=180528 RepID=A0AAF0EN81_9BASI|nr:non-specific serine/threonine protein kinase [Malassezia nana]